MAEDVLTIVARAFAAQEGIVAGEAADFADWHWEEFEDHARAALAALEAAGGFVGLWRTDMENAPRDGRWLLIECNGVFVARYDEETELWYFPVDGCAIDPTAWAALPAPPGEKP